MVHTATADLKRARSVEHVFPSKPSRRASTNFYSQSFHTNNTEGKWWLVFFLGMNTPSNQLQRLAIRKAGVAITLFSALEFGLKRNQMATTVRATTCDLQLLTNTKDSEGRQDQFG